MDVSVIIPTYNRQWCLSIAINSCRNTQCQTEIIVVDDGSTDGTWEWLQTQTDIRSIYQNNQGQTYAINNGFSISEGKYIRFLDSDDFLESGIIDKQFQLAEGTNGEIVVSNIAGFDFKKQTITIKHTDPLNWEDFMAKQLSTEYGSHFLGMLFHRKLVEQVPRRPDFALREDRIFLLEVALLNPKIVYLPEVAGYWVSHSSQMQANYQGLKSSVTNWQHLTIFKKICSSLEKQGGFNENRKKAVCQSLWPLAHWIAKTHLKEATDVANWIFEMNPGFEIPEKGLIGWLYKKIGFTKTEKILRIRRMLIYGFWK